MIDLKHGDCLDVLRTLPADSVDAIVTDPPYGLAFMGKRWDYDVPSVEIWAECLRVLKPGGHLLAFAGTRTQHRMAVRIEDAGFEIRDMIAWVYGSGFPKSLDVSKALDKMDAAQEQEARRYRFTAWVRSTGVTARQIDDATNTCMGSRYTTHPTQPAIMTREHLDACRHLFGDVPQWVEREADIRSVESKNFSERKILGVQKGAMAGWSMDGGTKFIDRNITAPATPEAQQWSGWGTALKPALEPITMARKPFKGTVAANVLEHGTGAINVDASRVTTEDQERDAHAYKRLSFLGSSSCILGSSREQLFDSLQRICAALRSYSTGGIARVHNVLDLDGTLLDHVLCEQLVVRLFPNGVWCGGSSWSAQDFLCGCQSCRHSCDEHIRLLREAAQDGPPSLADALERICLGQLAPERIPACQCIDRLSSSDDFLLALSLSFLVGEYCTLYSHDPQKGRWPANLIHDGSEEVVGLLNDAARFFYCAKASKRDRDEGLEGMPLHDVYSEASATPMRDQREQTQRANVHPTVKPTDLMRYLCRLVTPPGGVVLDPFTGSGSTGKAAMLEGFQFIGIERESEYVEIARARIDAARDLFS